EIAPTHPDCRAAAESAARLLESLGHAVEPSHPGALDEVEVGRHFSMMYATHVARMVDVLGELTGASFGPDDLDPLNWALTELGRACTAQQYLATVDWLHGYTRRMAGWWASGFDLLLTPTLPQQPPPLGTFTPSRGSGRGRHAGGAVRRLHLAVHHDGPARHLVASRVERR